MASSMAFFWAEEPSAFRVPLGQSVAELPEDELDEVPPDAAPALLSEPHAARAIEPTRATPATWPRRWIFTVFKPLHGGNRWRAGCPTQPKVGRLGDAVA